MRFDAKTAHKIATGKVTCLISPTMPRGERHSVMFERRRLHEDGPNPKGEETIWDTKCRVRITEHYTKQLGQIDQREYQAAGYPERETFKQAWKETRNWLEFGYVYVAWFEVIHEGDKPRFMAKVTGSTPVSKESIDPDVEMVPSVWQQRFSRESMLEKRQRVVRDRIDRGMLAAEERIRLAREEARRFNVDVTRQEQRLLAALEKRDRSGALAAVESMERKVRSKAA